VRGWTTESELPVYLLSVMYQISTLSGINVPVCNGRTKHMAVQTQEIFSISFERVKC